MESMELVNHETIRTLGEKETLKYLEILKVDTIKQVDTGSGRVDTTIWMHYLDAK